jgi:hypothetical protein
MKLKPQLLRDILLAIERRSETRACTPGELALGSPYEQTVYHVALLADAGLIQTSVRQQLTGGVLVIVRMTWQGHEFLDAARDDSRWERALELTDGGIAELQNVLVALLRRQLGLEREPGE